MKRIFSLLITASIALSLLFIPQTMAGTKKLDEKHHAIIAQTVLTQIEDAGSSETIDAIVWSTGKIDTFLSGNQDVLSFQAFDNLSCYFVRATPKGLTQISQIPQVLRVQENYKISAPNVTFAQTKDKKNWGLDDLKVPDLWKEGIRGQNVTVGLLDTGVDAKHPDLVGKVKKFAVFDFSGKLDPSENEPFDNIGHGTHCAGIIAGGKADLGTGVAPDANLIVGSVLPTGTGSLSQVIGGMNWIVDPDGDPNTNDAPSIVSMSLGGSIPDEDMVAAADALERKGIALVASIGNAGEGTTGSPGNIPSALSVGAYNKDRQVPSFSGGTTIDWEMEPYHMTVTKPDVSAPGVDIYSTYLKGKYAYLSGTSMATPHVAGVCALLKSAYPDLSTVDLKSILAKTSDDLGGPGWDNRFGAGAVNPKAAIDFIKKTGKVKIDIQGTVKDPITLWVDNKMYRTDSGLMLHLAPGKTQIRLDSFGYKSLSSEQNVLSGKTAVLQHRVEELPKVSFEGIIMGKNGNPAEGSIKFLGTNFEVATDENGSFSEKVPSGEYFVEYWGVGCVPRTEKVDFSKDSPKKIVLENTNVLVATSQYQTPSQYYTRRFDTYVLRAFDEAGIAYCPVNPRNFDVSTEMMQKFDRVYWFGGESSLSATDAMALSDYMKYGGKLLISGSNLLYYENYRREHSFLKDTFDVSLKRGDTSLTSIVGVKGDNIGDGLVISISGGDGASNQLGADGFAPNKNLGEPFLHYLGPKERNPVDMGYAGIKMTNGLSIGVYLSFGFEGINFKESRTSLLSRIEKWFGGFGGIDLTLVDDKGKPVFSKIKVQDQYDVQSDADGHIKMPLLPAGKLTLKASAMGYNDQTFTAEVVAGKTSKVSFTLTNPVNITISGQINDGVGPMKCNIKVTGSEPTIYTTNDDGTFSLILPKFKYNLKFYKKGYLSYTVDVNYDTNVPLKIKLEKSSKQIAFVQQTSPTWDPQNVFGGIPQDYDRIARGAGFDYDNIIIPANATISLEDLQQFERVLWFCGHNDEIGQDWWLDVITQFVKEGGELAIIGENVPVALAGRPELAKMLGFELVQANSNIFTIKGVKGDPIGDDMLFAIYHRYLRNGLKTMMPSMKPSGAGVTCFELVGGGAAGVRVSADKQKTVVLSFGFESIYSDSKDSQTILKRIVDFFTK